MDKNILSVSRKMKNGILDDDYTLFDDATILHEFDKHSYPGGQNLQENLTVDELSDTVKQRLLDSASNENKEVVRRTLRIN
jgi:hypothetical protein